MNNVFIQMTIVIEIITLCLSFISTICAAVTTYLADQRLQIAQNTKFIA